MRSRAGRRSCGRRATGSEEKRSACNETPTEPDHSWILSRISRRSIGVRHSRRSRTPPPCLRHPESGRGAADTAVALGAGRRAAFLAHRQKPRCSVPALQAGSPLASDSCLGDLLRKRKRPPGEAVSRRHQTWFSRLAGGAPAAAPSADAAMVRSAPSAIKRPARGLFNRREVLRLGMDNAGSPRGLGIGIPRERSHQHHCRHGECDISCFHRTVLLNFQSVPQVF